MTIIVWDGTTLAADKRAIQADLHRTVTKIRKIRGHLCGCTGDLDLAQEMFEWFENGATKETLPACQRTDDKWQTFVVVTPDKRFLKYERSHLPIDYTEEVLYRGWYACGSGRDFAYGAMHMGANARLAVEIASHYCGSCGSGVDTLTLEDV